MKLEQQHDALLRQIPSKAPGAVHAEKDVESILEDLKAYKESSKHWKREYHREKKQVTATNRDFQHLLQKSNGTQMEVATLRQTVTEQERRIADLGETNDELQRANQVQDGELKSVTEQLSALQTEQQRLERKMEEYQQRNQQLVEYIPRCTFTMRSPCGLCTFITCIPQKVLFTVKIYEISFPQNISTKYFHKK